MEIKFKYISIFEFFIITVLLALLIYAIKNPAQQNQNEPNPTGLLSPRIYSGSLKPENYMIINFAPLKLDLERFIAENNLNASIYVENMRNGAYMGINEKTGFFPTSLNKLPVAILMMNKIEQGDLSLDTELEIKDADRTASSGDLYAAKEKKLSLNVLLEKLLKESDSTALNVLLGQVNQYDLQFVIDYYGIEINLYQQNKPQLVTPKSISNLFISLYFSTVLEPQHSEYLLSLLKNSAFDINGMAKLPDNVIVAHKYGENYHNKNKFFHDCGIMYINETRIFYCIMTKDLDEKDAGSVIGFAVKEIHDYVVESKEKFEKLKNQK